MWNSVCTKGDKMVVLDFLSSQTPFRLFQAEKGIIVPLLNLNPGLCGLQNQAGSYGVLSTNH